MTEESAQPGSTPPEFEGSWERPDRSLTAAAFFGFLIIGVIYYYAQGFLAMILVFSAGNITPHGTTFIEQMTNSVAALKTPVRYSLVFSEFLFMLLPTFWLVTHWHTKKFFTYVRLRRVGYMDVLLAILATVCFIPVSSFIADYFLKQINFPDFLGRINEELFTSYSGTEFILLICVVCVTPAICEETLFRGYIQRTLERSLGIKSIFIVGILFGLYHMEPLNLVSLSCLGIMIGFFYYRSKSLLPGMAAHFTNNALGITSMYKTPGGNPRIPFLSADVPTFLVVVGFVATAGLLYIYWRRTAGNFASGPVSTLG